MSRQLSRRDLLRYGAAAGTGLLLPRYGLLRPRRAHAATTFNVHYGLSAWPQNTALGLGTRRSNVGNAYQVITPGTTSNVPGTGPTGTGSDITDGTVHWKYLSAIDYTSLQNWANAMPGTQSVDYIVLLWNNGLITTTTSVQFLSYTATAGSFQTLITCAPGEGLIGNRSAALYPGQSNGVMFQAPSSGTETFPYFFITTANVTIRGIQYVDPQAADNIGFDMAGNNGRLSGCILDAWQPYYSPANNCGIDNSLIITRQIGNSGIWPVKWDNTSTGAYVVNCTVIQAGDGGSGSVVVGLNNSTIGFVRNCAFFGPGTGDPINSQNAANMWTVDHCVFALTSDQVLSSPSNSFGHIDGGGNLFSKTAANQFIDASTNFRLKRGADCINTGTTDLTDIPAGNDIYGNPRGLTGAWDIGANEFMPASGGLPLVGVG